MTEETLLFEFESCLCKGRGKTIQTGNNQVIRLELDQHYRGQLPRNIVLKKECEETAKEYYQDGTSLFDMEIKVYRHLETLQGKHIPKFYGIAYLTDNCSIVFNGRSYSGVHDADCYQGEGVKDNTSQAGLHGCRMLVLSDIGGINLMDDKMPRIDRGILLELLKAPLGEIRRKGVNHEDTNPANMLYCDETIKVVDFEMAGIDHKVVRDCEMRQDVDDWCQAIVKRYLLRQDYLDTVRNYRA